LVDLSGKLADADAGDLARFCGGFEVFERLVLSRTDFGIF